MEFSAWRAALFPAKKARISYAALRLGPCKKFITAKSTVRLLESAPARRAAAHFICSSLNGDKEAGERAALCAGCGVNEIPRRVAAAIPAVRRLHSRILGTELRQD